MKKLLLTTAIISSFALSQPVIAHEDGIHNDHPADKAVSESQPAKVQHGLEKIQAGMTSISEMVDAGKLDTIHPEIEKLEPYLTIIKENSGMDGEKKTRLEASLKQLKAQLGKLHVASDSKDAEKTKTELRKTEGALKLLENALK